MSGTALSSYTEPVILSPTEITALVLSLKVALWSVVASLPIGLALAWVLARTSFFGKSALDAVIHLPLVLPPVVIGYFLLIAFGKQGLIGAFFEKNLGIEFVFRWTGAALASAVMGFPLLVRAIRQALEGGPAPRSHRVDAGSQSALGICHGYLAADTPGRAYGNVTFICTQSR